MIPLEGWIGEKIAFPVVVSGPSGVGKTSLVDILLAGDPDSVRSISATTRTIRENEVDGRDYFYVGKERFLHMKEAGELVESAVYVAEQYGTPKSFLEERIAEGKSVILNIEVQGGLQVRSYDPASVLIFVIPPSWEELRRRLMNRGTETAESIEELLAGGSKKAADARGAAEKLRPINDKALKTSERASVKEIDPRSRCMDREDYLTLEDGKVSMEAHRCLDCSCVAVNASDVAPALIALGATIKTTKRSIAAEDFYTVGLMTTTVLDVDELVTEIFVPAPEAGTKFSFQKFRVRNSIDFPIVSVASALNFEGKKISAARIVFGAVAPVPLRAMNVEETLIGKTASEETAELAGAVGAKQVFPLERNRYKVQILKGLLRKALLAGN